MTNRGPAVHPLSLSFQRTANRASLQFNSSEPSSAPSSELHDHASRPEAGPVESLKNAHDHDDEQGDPNSPSNGSNNEDAPSPRTARRASFIPPGQDSPCYVPFGVRGVATEEQGNREGINKSLRGLIVDEELDNQQKRPAAQRLTYVKIAAKYPAWNVSTSGLRWHNRRYFTNPEGSLERVPKFSVQHLNALRNAVPRAADRRGRTSWRVVREDVMRRTGSQFGIPALRKRWDALKADDLHKIGDLKAVADVEEEEWIEAPDDEPGVEQGIKRNRKDEDEDDEGGMGGGAAQFVPGRPDHRSLIHAK